MRKSTRQTKLDRKTIRAILKGEKVKASTLVKVVMGYERNSRVPQLEFEKSVMTGSPSLVEHDKGVARIA